MKGKITLLREQRNEKARLANELNDKYPADKRMSAEDAKKMDALLVEIEQIDAEIAVEQRRLNLVAEKALDDPNAARDRFTREPQNQSEHSAALRAYLGGGLTALTPEQFKAMQARVNDDIRAAMRIQGAMSTTTPAEGGYTVATEYQRQLEEAMKLFGGMRAVSRQIRTATGATMNFPTTDATAEIGELVGQNTAVALGETTFGNTALDVYKYSSKKIGLPFELLQDSMFDLEGYLRELLAMRIGRITNQHFTTGTGTGQPRGLVTASAAGKVGTTGQTATVIYDDLVDLEHSVDPAYRNQPGVGYMLHDQSLKVIRKIKDTQGRPIFVPGYEQGNPGGAPDRLMGRPIQINQDVAQMAANAKSILFGQLSKYTIRDVMDLTVFRMADSAFTLLGQVGFVAFVRTGGNLIDAGGAVKHYANSAT